MGNSLRQYSSQSLRALQTNARRSFKKIEGLPAGRRALGLLALAAVVGWIAKSHSESSLRHELQSALAPTQEWIVRLGEQLGLKPNPDLLKRKKLPSLPENPETAPEVPQLWMSQAKDQILVGKPIADEWAVLARAGAREAEGWTYLGQGWTGVMQWLESLPQAAEIKASPATHPRLRDPKEIVY